MNYNILSDFKLNLAQHVKKVKSIIILNYHLFILLFDIFTFIQLIHMYIYVYFILAFITVDVMSYKILST